MVFLAALQDVPRALYDAAKIDGATRWHEMRHITIPLITPAILYQLINGLIGAFQYFTIAWIMTRGGPLRASTFYGLHLYHHTFELFHMGYASALAWVLFLVCIVASIITFKSSGRWVHYSGG